MSVLSSGLMLKSIAARALRCDNSAFTRVFDHNMSRSTRPAPYRAQAAR